MAHIFESLGPPNKMERDGTKSVVAAKQCTVAKTSRIPEELSLRGGEAELASLTLLCRMMIGENARCRFSLLLFPRARKILLQARLKNVVKRGGGNGTGDGDF